MAITHDLSLPLNITTVLPHLEGRDSNSPYVLFPLRPSHNFTREDRSGELGYNPRSFIKDWLCDTKHIHEPRMDRLNLPLGRQYHSLAMHELASYPDPLKREGARCTLQHILEIPCCMSFTKNIAKVQLSHANSSRTFTSRSASRVHGSVVIPQYFFARDTQHRISQHNYKNPLYTSMCWLIHSNQFWEVTVMHVVCTFYTLGNAKISRSPSVHMCTKHFPSFPQQRGLIGYTRTQIHS